MPSVPRTRLGEILVKNGAITEEQLAHALAQQPRVKLPLGQVLLKLNYLTDETMRQALGRQLNVPYVDLEKVIIDRSLAQLIDRSYARKHALFPVAQIGTTLTVAMDDPTQAQVIHELERQTGGTITVVTASHRAIQKASGLLYGNARQEEEGAQGDRAEGDGNVEPQSDQAGDLLTVLLGRALDAGASDLYLAQRPGAVDLNMRVDGVTLAPKLAGLERALTESGPELIARVKSLAKIADTGRMRPRRGSAQVWVVHGGKRVALDLRVSAVPTLGGANIAIRLLDPMKPRTLADLGFSVKAAAGIEKFFTNRQGVILVTGPLGSGRVATLYSFLRRLHAPGRRIVSVEEQIAHIDEDFSQAEVDIDSGETFAPYLRAFLGHHPEVLMVGALSDPEVAGPAFRAAEGGSLVLSTLLTSRAVEAVDGLYDLRVPATLVARSLIGVIAQRIVRKLCSNCRQPATKSPAGLDRLFRTPPSFPFFEGVGCEQCHDTGYRGHAMVADIWSPDDEDRAAIIAHGPMRARASDADGFYSMVEDAYDRIATGMTTVDELHRALPASAVAEFKARFS